MTNMMITILNGKPYTTCKRCGAYERIHEAETVKENLIKTKRDAITQYCYPEPEITTMVVYVPEHLCSYVG